MKKRVCALLLTAAVTAAAILPAGAAQLPAAYDETYYATLDYYGAPMEASVVKSYQMGGQSSITDYGVYDEVVNLTDDAVPVRSDGKLTFTPQGESGKFYFEGKTTRPFEELPWTINLSYKLNGAPALAEDLAGKTGLVEMDVDVLPNAAAGEYARTNLVLTIATAFNDDDITSLEAPGAQVQLVGNLRAVLFAVLPGEEQHFAIRVGSDSFESAGLLFLAVPATLRQLEQVAELKETKEKTQESLDAMDASLDVILNTLDGMSGSLNATANGLDRLDAARGTVSAGKGEVYDKTDAALDGLNAVSGALAALDTYNGDASQAVSDSVTILNDMNTAVQGLRPQLEATRSTVNALRDDAQALKGLLTDVEGYNQRATDIAASLAGTLDDLEDEDQGLEVQLMVLASALKNAKGMSNISASDMLGLLPEDQAAQMKEVLELHGQYVSYLNQNGLNEAQLSFRDFIIAGAYQKYRAAVAEQVKATLTAAGLPGEQIAPTVEALLSPSATAETLAGAGITDPATQAKILAAQSQEKFLAATAISGEYVQTAQAAQQAYDEFSAKMPAVNTVNKKIGEINALITGITQPTGDVVATLSELCGEVGDTGVVGDMTALAGLCRDLLKTMKEHEGEGAALLDDASELADILDRMIPLTDTILANADSLVGVLTTYEPTVQSALVDVGNLSSSLQSAITDTTAALSAMESLLKQTGPNLDAGTRQTLSGISAALRKSTVGLDQTGTIRSAKDTITGLIDDEWDAHTGEVDGLLNMDAAAVPVSMTSEKNPAPTNIQYIMRTQEIKVDEENGAAPVAGVRADTRTFWQRVADMFKGIWRDIVNFFSGNRE